MSLSNSNSSSESSASGRIANNNNVSTTSRSNEQPISEQQLQDRAITILGNNQLMLRYAVSNGLVSFLFRSLRPTILRLNKGLLELLPPRTQTSGGKDSKWLRVTHFNANSGTLVCTKGQSILRNGCGRLQPSSNN